MEYNYYPPQAGLPPPIGNPQQQHCSQIPMMPSSAMHESPMHQQQPQMMRQSLTSGGQPPPPQMMPQQQQQQHQPPPSMQQQTPPMHQQHMMHQTMPMQNQTYHQLPPHPPTPLSASPIHHPGSMHSNHSSQTNLSMQQPPSRPSTGPPPPMQHAQSGPPGPPQHQHNQHHHMTGPPPGSHQNMIHFNGLPSGPPSHPHHNSSHVPPGPPSLQPGMPPGPPSGAPPSAAGYGVTPPPTGPPLPHQMHHHPPPPQMAPQPPPPQMHHQVHHHNPHPHAPQPPMNHQMHPMHPSMDRHGSPFYQNIPQTEYRIIELNKRLQSRPRPRGPYSLLPSSIMGPTEDISWWERFACDFFDDDSTLTIKVPEEKQPTEYTIGRTLIPRFFKTYIDGGVSDFSIKLHHSEEFNHPNNPNWFILKCDHTDITTKNVFRHQSSNMLTYVVVHTEGQLTLEFCNNSMLDTLLIKSWRFQTRQCHEFIDRSMTTGGMPNPYLMEPVTRHGLTKMTINFLKMCMIMEPMQDIMLQHRQTGGKRQPKECLKQLLLRFNIKPIVEEKKQKRKRGARAANTGATKKSKANSSMTMVKNNMNFNNNIMSPASMGGGVPNLPLASQDVMVVGEPSMLGAEFGDENERRITRLENSQFDPSSMNTGMNNNSNNSSNNNNCNGAKMMNQQQSQPNCGTPPNSNNNGSNNISQMHPGQDQMSNCGNPNTPNVGIVGRMTPQDANCGPPPPHTPNNIGCHPQMAPQDQQLPNNKQVHQQQQQQPAPHQIQQQQPPPQPQAQQPLQTHQQDLDLSSSQ